MCNLLSSVLSLQRSNTLTHTHTCTFEHRRCSGGQCAGVDSAVIPGLLSQTVLILRNAAACRCLILLVVNLKMFSLMVFWQGPCRGRSGQLISPASCSALLRLVPSGTPPPTPSPPTTSPPTLKFLTQKQTSGPCSTPLPPPPGPAGHVPYASVSLRASANSPPLNLF